MRRPTELFDKFDPLTAKFPHVRRLVDRKGALAETKIWDPRSRGPQAGIARVAGSLQEDRCMALSHFENGTRLMILSVFVYLSVLTGKTCPPARGGGNMDTHPALSVPFFNNTFRRYGAAVGATLVALLAREALTPLVRDSLPYITLFPALAFSALSCGVGPSAVAILVGLLGARFWFIAPTHSFSVPDVPQLTGIFAFLLAASVIVLIGEMQRRSKEALQEFHQDLELRVRERTAQLDTANQSLGDLTGRLLHLQDEERRRIARELHDSVGQSLAALSMNLSSLGADIDRIAAAAGKVSDSTSLVKDISTDIRTISYLLHPPLLDEAGLVSALRWFIEGFTERSKIRVDLDLPGDFDRLSRDLETAIFRLVQECLTNIHRHSGSAVARIRITRSADEVRVEVQDEGKGIPPEKQSELLSAGTPGVGIRGMRERIRQLGGTLEITSQDDQQGAKISATLPTTTEEKPLAHAGTVAGRPQPTFVRPRP
jgi:signal transduction histidine kinase